MNPIKVIKNVSGLTYDELEQNLSAMGIDIKATTLANRFKSTSNHSKMTDEELRIFSLMLVDKNPPEGAKPLINAFSETVSFINLVLGTNIVSVGGDSVADAFISDEDLDFEETETETETETELSDDDWEIDDDWDIEEEWDEEVVEEKDNNDDLMDIIFSEDVPDEPEDEEDNLFSAIDNTESGGETLPSTPDNFEKQPWLDDGDDFDVANAKI